ncbi:GNAT family N-acetyltransferase [Flavobacterium terrigena]|uniref:Acetyltransferase (GNAT) family protein n=1 Tax=Flavobacterium terrigena TaxID=402734 RepID=A0A1H6WXX2_9FLAO|nr:GNAT family N-acetyltransferase [Flavobacterium terrigena]SEJ21713.1 Acetyltransferase (GNAT) family protein [Flavobacterium terrigena]
MITFKDLQQKQIPTIVSMMQDFYAIDNYPIDVAESKQLFETFITNPNLGKAWLIYQEEEIVGYVILTFVFSFEYKGILAFLDELYIKNVHQGKGFGKQAVQFIQQESSQLNVKMLYLEVEEHNENAQKLYLAHDFVNHNRKILKHKL